MIKFLNRMLGQSEEEKYALDKYRLALFEEIKQKNIKIARISNWSDEKLNEMTIRMMITRLEILDDEKVERSYQEGLESFRREENVD